MQQLPKIKIVNRSPDGLYRFPENDSLILSEPEFNKLKALMGEGVTWIVIHLTKFKLTSSEEEVDLAV